MSATIASKMMQVAFLLSVFCGCIDTGAGTGWDTKSYRQAVQSGRKQLKEAAEMESQFANSEHMIIMYGAVGSLEHEWQTVIFFGGRYELTMSVNVELSPDGTKVIGTSESPTFVFWVCKSIADDGGGASFDSTRERKFGVETWIQFKESGFDIRVLDPAYDGSVLPGFEEYADGWQESRRVWR